MALLMVHLFVAERWARRHLEYSDSPEFYLGAISPDAIHIRDRDDKSHKNEIHLNNWGSPHPEEIIRYWKTHHTPFDIGYGIHALTDAQWVPRFRERLPEILNPDGTVRTKIYYNDTFLTDFEIYRENELGKYLIDLVEAGQAPADHPLLSFYELDEWRKMMVDNYRSGCPPTNDPVRFINREYVEEFIEECQDFLDETYGRYENE